MKKIMTNIFCWAFFLTLVACSNNGAGGSKEGSKDNKIIVTENLLSADITHSHIDNLPNKSDIVTVRLDQDELNKILKINDNPELKITATVDGANKSINFDESALSKVVINDKKFTPIAAQVATTCTQADQCGQGGLVNIKFFVNGIPQKSTVSFMVSQRAVQFAEDQKEHIKGEDAQIYLSPVNLTPGDSFFVELLPTGVTITSAVNPGTLKDKQYFCEFSAEKPKCTISYTIRDKGPYNIGTKIDDVQTDQTFNVIVCDGIKKLSFDVIGADYIGLNNSEVKFTLTRRCISINDDLVVNLKLDGTTIDTDKKIGEFVKVAPSVIIPANAKTVSFSAELMTQDPQDIKFKLGSGFVVTPSVANKAKYPDVVIEPDHKSITNRDNNTSSFIETDISYITVSAGNETNFTFTKHLVDTLEFNLYPHGGTEPVSTDMATISVNENEVTIKTTDKLLPAIDYELRAQGDGKKIKINNSDFLPVQVNPAKITFDMTPGVKNILRDFSNAYFYLKVEKHNKTTKHSLNGKLKNVANVIYLSADDIKSAGCAGLLINKITVDEAGNPIESPTRCTLDESNCTCGVKNGTDLDGVCMFKIQAPDAYTAEASCKIKVRTDEELDLGSTTLQSIAGRDPIEIIANTDQNYDFINAGKIEMWAQKSDGSNLLNNWTIVLNKDSLDCKSSHDAGKKCVFDDDALVAATQGEVSNQMKSYFEANPGQNLFKIKNYPGRNTMKISVSLPKINFIMGYQGNKATNPWGDDRCSVGNNMPNLGCNEGGPEYINFLRGPAYIDANVLAIDGNDKLMISGDNNSNVNIKLEWTTYTGNPITKHGIYSDDGSYHLKINITRARLN